MKTRVHYVTLRLVFDKKCTRYTALNEAKSNLNRQNFYSYSWEDDYPGEFYVRGVRSARKPK